MKENTSPPSPQPKQWNDWRAVLTIKEGVFSACDINDLGRIFYPLHHIFLLERGSHNI
jgi:hypothetical protein